MTINNWQNSYNRDSSTEDLFKLVTEVKKKKSRARQIFRFLEGHSKSVWGSLLTSMSPILCLAVYVMNVWWNAPKSLNSLGEKNVNIQDAGNAGSETEVKAVTYSLQALETWAGTVYLQSMIIVRVSLSLASWKGGWPHTSMKRMTPRLQISTGKRVKMSSGRMKQTKHNFFFVVDTLNWFTVSVSAWVHVKVYTPSMTSKNLAKSNIWHIICIYVQYWFMLLKKSAAVFLVLVRTYFQPTITFGYFD